MKIAVRAPNWIGDAVLSLPALASLQAAFPKAEIRVIARDWVKELFVSGTPAAGVIDLPDDRSLGGLRAAARLLRQERFDLGLLLTNSFGSALLFSLARIPERWGYRREGRGVFLTKGVNLEEGGPAVHHADYYLGLVRGLGLKTIPPSIRLSLTAAEKKAGRKLLDSLGLVGKKPLVILNPGASYGPAKRWPAANFATLGTLLQNKMSCQVLVTGSAEEAGLAQTLAGAMRRKPVLLSGRTNLRQLLGVLAQADLFITNDSGPMHLANALSVPVIGLFGPTEPAVTRPFQQPSTVIWKGAVCWPCLYRSCPYGHECMTAITPEEVLEAAGGYIR
jgi:heptosyltransferase II